MVMSALHLKADMCGAVAHVWFGPQTDNHIVYSITSRRSAGKAWLPNITTAQVHPHRIISRSMTGNLSNKIIQKGLAFRRDPSATVFASGALLLLRDPAPPA